MKKLLTLVFCMAFFAAMAVAQNPTYTAGTGGITGIDKLGAHQNGGRGCTGCHAPHSGGRGGGGNQTGSVANTDVNSGSVALWGQDTTPLLGYTITASGYTEVLPANEVTGNSGEVTGIMFCLSCHDGNVAKGGMMTNQLYEQKIGKLPAGVYGPNSIPTLLGNDGTSTGNYSNDHPVGVNATIGAVLSTNANAFSAATTAGALTYTAGVNTNYDKFVSNYGNFFQGRATVGVTATPTVASSYVLCTTCHTPHTMYSASGTWGGNKGTYPTYFFLVAPYNPGSLSVTNDGTKASSATQFCRSCHFTGAGGANEGSGIMNVTTAF